MPQSSGRIRAFDWLRGIAVLVMIQTHAMTLLRPERLKEPLFYWLNSIDGLVAPSFIFSAGFSLALVQVRGATGGMRLRRVRKTLRRLGEVLAVATLINCVWFPVFREPRWLLRMDILQCIGFGLLLALPLLAALAPRPRVLCWVTLALALCAFGVTPLAEHVRGTLARFVNRSSDALFPLLPWAGYVYLGASAGAVAATGQLRSLVRWLAWLLVLGVGIWKLAPVFVRLYPPHEFWISDPAIPGRQWAIVCAVVLVLLAFEHVAVRWQRGPVVWFVEVFGTSSLSAYFFHEMLLYMRIFGFSFAAWWGKRCDWGRYAALTALLIAMTFVLTWVTDKLYRHLNGLLERAPGRGAGHRPSMSVR